MGTPEFAVPSLRAVAARCELVLVVTQPDRPRGRGRKLAASEVAEAAEELGLHVMKPDTLKAPALRAEVAALRPDLIAVVAFGAILSAEWLAVPRLGAINLHGSLLPDYRGASPVQRALWDGRNGSGATTLWMDEGIDTGDLILQRWTAIEAADTADTLAARIAAIGAPLLADSLLLAARGEAPRRQQPRDGSYARKLAKHDGRVDFGVDAVTVWNRQRAVTPWPGATTGFQGRGLLILECRPHDMLPAAAAPGTVTELGRDGVTVACGTGAVTVLRVKPDGRSAMDAMAWARGVRVVPGNRLECNEEAAT